MFCKPFSGDPTAGGTFSLSFSPYAAESSSDTISALLPQGTSFIGSGAFGTVRVGWLQERKRQRPCSDEHTSEEIIILGTCAAVAVKRVVVPDAWNPRSLHRSISHRQELLLRELQVMECIRTHPHPNIVQCWGFLFGEKKEKKKFTEQQSLTGETITDVEKEYTSGMILTTLEKERKRLESSGKKETSNENMVEVNNDMVDIHILNSALYVDLCLSLCSSGSLVDYIHRKVNEAIRVSTQLDPSEPSTQFVDSDTAVTDKISTMHGLTGSTSEGDTVKGSGNPSSSSVDVGHSSKSNTNTLPQLFQNVENAEMQSETRPTTTTETISAELVVRERDIVAITYALTNALRHTHETLRTLHRDVKPANVLICSGVGKTPVYTLQPLSRVTQTSLVGSKPLTDTASAPKQEKPAVSGPMLHTEEDSVEFALFSNCPESVKHKNNNNTSTQEGANTENISTTAGEDIPETPATLVVPLEAGGQRLQCTGYSSRGMMIEYMPQAEAWRIQLADFGVATGVGKLTGETRCGTFPFMAPEVAGDGCSGVNGYSTAADVYSLGVTLQHIVVHLVLENGDVRRVSQRRMQALGALWIDEDDKENNIKTETDTDIDRRESRSHFVVPNAWRCARELDNELFIRTPPLVDQTVRMDNHDKNDHRNTFAIPRSWRCCDELLEQRYVRHKSTSDVSDNNTAVHHDYLLASLPQDSNDGEANEQKERRKSRCKSCGKLHRNFIELLNAMTATQPSQRPPLSTVLQSAAIIDQGSFVRNTTRGRAGKCDSTVVTADSTGSGINANRFLRARQRAQEKERERNRITASMATFHFDMTNPNSQQQRQGKEEEEQQQQQESKDAEGDAASTVLLWRPPSLRFLRASRERLENRSD
ncbi:putative protein kinase [Trypanosoma theileri]|uniref:Protein kinase domain-containing protein n=1 Tax=Trypanosoma theileri TaxID=67003 RepID=A0A1X0P6D3_9TRYP|nr:putative protein kinase [Trypanosoma theileri]ORC92381.1 putative protein kinase [Trypanosoma theileri]